MERLFHTQLHHNHNFFDLNLFVFRIVNFPLQRIYFIFLLEFVKDFLFESLLATLNLFELLVLPLEVLVTESVGEELVRMLVMRHQFEISVELIDESSFLIYIECIHTPTIMIIDSIKERQSLLMDCLFA